MIFFLKSEADSLGSIRTCQNFIHGPKYHAFSSGCEYFYQSNCILLRVMKQKGLTRLLRTTLDFRKPYFFLTASKLWDSTKRTKEGETRKPRKHRREAHVFINSQREVLTGGADDRGKKEDGRHSWY